MKSIFLILLILISASAHSKNFWEKDPVWLPKEALDVSTALTAPPSPQSDEDKRDLKVILADQIHRTQLDCKRAATEVQITLGSFFGPPYGPLTDKEVLAWSPFFEKVRTDSDFFVQGVKRNWNRPRPYAAHPQVKPCIAHEMTNSYPSGHATIARVFSRVLTLLDPRRKTHFESRARQIAYDRVLAGVHHPTDIEAGSKLGDEIFATLSQNRKFQKELQNLK